MKGKKWLLLMAFSMLLLLVVANMGSVKALYTPQPTWPADYQWRNAYDTITASIHDTPDTSTDVVYPFRQDFLWGPDTTTRPSTVALENLREIVSYAGSTVIDEGYYDKSTGIHTGYTYNTKVTIDGSTIPQSVNTTWTNGQWKLQRTLFCMEPDVLGLCVIDYKIYWNPITSPVGHAVMAVLWNYPLQNPATTAYAAHVYIDDSMTQYYDTHPIAYFSAIPGLVFKICYSFDDCMKQQTLGGGTLSKHSVEAWSGATPVDFLANNIPYSSWSPETPLAHQPSGSKVLWGIVHVPEPYDMTVDVCTLTPSYVGVGPQNAFSQMVTVTYVGREAPVGGIYSPIYNVQLAKPFSWAPFAILMTAIVLAASVVYKKKRQTGKPSNQTH